MNRLILIAFCVCTGSILAHEVRPAYLEINATGENEYSVIWKQPLLNGRPLSLQPDFPSDCARSSTRIEALGTEALIERIELQCASSLKGRIVGVSGLTKTLTDVLVRILSEHHRVAKAVERGYAEFYLAANLFSLLVILFIIYPSLTGRDRCFYHCTPFSG